MNTAVINAGSALVWWIDRYAAAAAADGIGTGEVESKIKRVLNKDDRVQIKSLHLLAAEAGEVRCGVRHLLRALFGSFTPPGDVIVSGEM